MKTNFTVAGLVILSCLSITFAEVLFDEKFDTNLSAWTLLDEVGSSGSVDIGLDGGELTVSLTNVGQWMTMGVESIERFSMPTEAGKKLVVDFYGINTGVGGVDSHSYPWYAVSAFSSAEYGMFTGWFPNWIAVKGWDASYLEWVQSYAGYVSIGDPNVPRSDALKHIIMVIDDVNISVYIEDDYYENLINPTPLYVTPTSSIFAAGTLESGLYVVVGAARYTSWYTGTCSEKFDGVKVSHLGSIPADCNEVNSMGYGLKADLNDDCSVDIEDLSELVDLWTICVDPQDALCDHPWEF